MASKIAASCLRQTARGMATAASAPPVGSGKAKLRGEFVPVYVVLGLILTSLSLGAYTAESQLACSPSVRVSKKRREILPEVEEPERIVEESSRYINRSIFRRVAKMQDFDAVRAGISDPTRPADPSRNSIRMETLKSVGVETGPHAAA